MAESQSWLLLEELLERGDSEFITELRKVHDAERLGSFAQRWFADSRPWARQLLFDYLILPLNAFRHEALVKRLFKLAEKADDDALMARFLVAFDRSVRRVKSDQRRQLRGAFATRPEAETWMRLLNETGAEYVNLRDLEGRFQANANWLGSRKRGGGARQWESQYVDRREEAEALVARWKKEGANHTHIHDHGGQYQVWAMLRGEFIRSRSGSTMPRDKTYTFRNPRTGKQLEFSDLRTRFRLKSWPVDLAVLPARLRTKLERLRLFSVHTRNYLRRRTWRYFRQLGKEQPNRYVPALVEALKLYTDEDTADGLALLDNWGLVHALFHRSPALIAKTTGWTIAPDRSLGELTPAPIYEELWLAAPLSLLELLRNARCRPVRQWVVHLIRRDPAAVMKHLAIDELLNLLMHADNEVVTLAGETLERVPGLDLVPLERWLALLETPNPTALDIICALMAKHVRPEQMTFDALVQLASSRPAPIARLGASWLRTKSPQSEEDCLALLGLAEAQSDPVRGEIVHQARKLLSASPYFRPEWVLEFMDSRHEDVRTEGWAWMQEEPRARDQVDLWRRLLESPYDDVRLKLVADLEQRVAKTGPALTDFVALDPFLVRFLWASVLLNIHRGHRQKPPVVAQIVRRLDQRPDDAKDLLPILCVALRSLRGPEWRAGLAGVVQAVEQRPELEADVHALFPELRI
jgi:hypothetical protein